MAYPIKKVDGYTCVIVHPGLKNTKRHRLKKDDRIFVEGNQEGRIKRVCFNQDFSATEIKRRVPKIIQKDAEGCSLCKRTPNPETPAPAPRLKIAGVERYAIRPDGSVATVVVKIGESYEQAIRQFGYRPFPYKARNPEGDMVDKTKKAASETWSKLKVLGSNLKMKMGLKWNKWTTPMSAANPEFVSHPSELWDEMSRTERTDWLEGSGFPQDEFKKDFYELEPATRGSFEEYFRDMLREMQWEASEERGNPSGKTDAERAMAQLKGYKGDNPWQDIFLKFDIDGQRQDEEDKEGTEYVFFEDGSELAFRNGKWEIYVSPYWQKSSNPALSQKILPWTREYIRAYKKGDKEMLEHSRKQIAAIAGERAMPYAPTRRELSDPEMFAKMISCSAQAKKPKKRWAACRASVESNPTAEPLVFTKINIAENAIRDMFFHQHYNKRVPDKDIKFILRDQHFWGSRYGSKNLKSAWKHLVKDGYIRKEDNYWLWGLMGMEDNPMNAAEIQTQILYGVQEAVISYRKGKRGVATTLLGKAQVLWKVLTESEQDVMRKSFPDAAFVLWTDPYDWDKLKGSPFEGEKNWQEMLMRAKDSTRNAPAQISTLIVSPNPATPDCAKWVAQGYERCSMQFEVTAPTTDEAIAIVNEIGDYNKFNPDKIILALNKLRGITAGYKIGREYSPVIYIHIPMWTRHAEDAPAGSRWTEDRMLTRSEIDDIEKKIKDAFAGTGWGEYNENNPTIGWIRIWWD